VGAAHTRKDARALDPHFLLIWFMEKNGRVKLPTASGQVGADIIRPFFYNRLFFLQNPVFSTIRMFFLQNPVFSTTGFF